MYSFRPDPISGCQGNSLVVRLFGPLSIGFSDGSRPRIPAGRQQALVALVASAPDMQRNRTWLIDKLWSDAAPGRGRANLRQLLHAMKQSFGMSFDEFFETTADTIRLRAERVELKGVPGDGELLEGFDLGQEGFEDWLREQRLSGGPGTMLIANARMAAAQPIKPRIAVLPFGELTGDARQGVGGALSHGISSGFARSQLIDAISHFSMQSLADRPVLSGGYCADLNADFAITGQCRLLNDALNVNVTLYDMSDQSAIWSDTHRIGFKSFLAGDETLVDHVVGQSLRLIMSRSVAASAARPLPELEAHRLLISGVSLMHSFRQKQFLRAETLLREVARRCQDHSEPLAWLAQWHLLRVFQKWSPDSAADHRQARDAVAAALDLNPSCPLSLAIDGNICTVLDGDFTSAVQRFTEAQAVNPSSAMISHLASVLETFRGNGNEAVRLTERGYALSPRDPRQPFFQTLSAGSYVVGGLYDQAVEMAEASLRHNPQHLSAHRCRIIGLQLGGRADEARAAAVQLMQIDPKLTVAAYLRDHPAGQSNLGKKLGDALKDSGIPTN